VHVTEQRVRFEGLRHSAHFVQRDAVPLDGGGQSAPQEVVMAGGTGPNSVERREPPLRARLVPLALDLRWTWSRETDEIWERIDATLWSATRNPWIVLQSIGDDRVAELARDRTFIDALDRCVRSAERSRRGSRRRVSAGWAASRTSAWSSVSPKRCRSTRVASASSPATI
jgi:hypothetical protein